MIFSDVYDDGFDRVFLMHDTIEVRVPRQFYNKLSKKYSDEEIVSMQEPKFLRHHYTGRELIYVTRESGIPLDRPHGLRAGRPGHQPHPGPARLRL